MTTGESTSVTGMREGVKEGGTGAWHIVSGVDPGFHLPFSKGCGVSVGRQESSEEEPESALNISASNSVGQGVEEGGSGDTMSQS